MESRYINRLHCIKVFILAALLCYTQSSHAKEFHVAFVKSSDAAIYSSTITKIKTHLRIKNNDHYSFSEYIASDSSLNSAELESNHDLVVSIGQAATDHILSLDIKTGHLATLITQKGFESAYYKAGSPDKTGALFIENPLTHQILLARVFFGSNSRISTLSAHPETSRIRNTVKYAKKLGISLYVETISPEDNLIGKLSHALESSDALLAIPEPAVFNQTTARDILLTTYRQRVPVIAFSEAYVKAGALAAVHTTLEQIAEQTAEKIISALNSNEFISEAPKYFSVSINKKVADALNIPTKDEETVKKEIMRLLARDS